MNRYCLMLALWTMLLPACRDQQRTTIDPNLPSIKIGVIGGFTGPNSVLAKSCEDGIKAALKGTKATNSGQRVELLERDDKGDPALTLAAFKELTSKKVSIVLMVSDSECILANQNYFEQHPIPILSVLASHPALPTETGNIIQIPIGDSLHAEIAAVFATDELFINRAAIIYDDSKQHYKALATRFAAKYRALGGQLWSYQTVNKTLLSSSQLGEISNNNVRFVYLAVGPIAATEMSAQLQELSPHPAIMGSDGLLSSVILEAPEMIDKLNNVYITGYYGSGMEFTPFGKRILRNFSSEFSSPKTVISGLGAEAATIALNALDRCADGTNAICVKAMVRNTRDLEGISGKLSVTKDGRLERIVLISKISNGLPHFVLKIH